MLEEEEVERARLDEQRGGGCRWEEEVVVRVGDSIPNELMSLSLLPERTCPGVQQPPPACRKIDREMVLGCWRRGI